MSEPLDKIIHRHFFQTEISDVIFAVVFAIFCRPLHFDN